MNYKKSLNHLARISLFLGWLLVAFSQSYAGNPDGDLRIEFMTAYNLVVSQSIESSTSYSPSSFYIGARICNDGSNDLTNVVVNIGDFLNGTPAIYPVDGVDEAALGYSYSGDFRLKHEASTLDATRFLGTIPADTCIMQYWLVSYPRLDANGNAVTGSRNDFSDDLALSFDVWATATDGVASLAADNSHTVYCRNELSAAANKIWPSNDNKVPDEYKSIVQDSLGWRTDYSVGDSLICPGEESLQLRGVWYDLGNINKGFDNDGDNSPDANVWLQPVGDPSLFDADCYRLVRTYGLMVIFTKKGGDMVIEFEDELYFTKIPQNTGGVGFVIYEYSVLNGPCSSKMTPYQEVASGNNNEKFNGDFGAGEELRSSLGPCVTLSKTANPTQLTSLPGTVTYSLGYASQTDVPLGVPNQSLPLVISEAIPTGTQYVAGSATASNTLPSGVSSYTVRYSSDGGTSWSLNEPATASDVTDIQWWLDDALPGYESGIVEFQVNVPASFPDLLIPNTAYLSFGNAPPFAQDDARVLLYGPNSISGTVWADDGGTTGADWNEIQDGDEIGLADILVSLYMDLDGNGVIDGDDYLWESLNSDISGDYLFDDLPDGTYIILVDHLDTDLPTGYVETTVLTYWVDLDVNNIDITGINELDKDFGFGPPLLVNKRLTSENPAYEGDTISFSITVSNRSDLPLAVIPVADTFDASRLEYLYAIPDPTTLTTGLTSPHSNTSIINWDNIGSVSGTEPIVYSDELPAKENLIAYWTFNEGKGSTANDYSGKGHAGVLQNTPTWTTGQYGNALDFSSDYVEIPHHADFNLDSMTIAAWVNADVMGDYFGVLTKGTTASPYSLQMGWPVANGDINDDNFRLSLNAGLAGPAEAESNTEFFPGSWHHIAVSYDGDSAYFFLDGVADGAVELNTAIVNNTESLIIGSELSGSADYFDGKIDEVALYNKTLSEAEVAQLMMYNSQLLALENMLLNWPMEQGTGLTTEDESGNGLTGSLVNGTGWTLGQVGNYALNFDGIDDYVLSDNMERDLDSTFAFSMWVKTSNSGSVQYLLAHDDIASNPDGEAWLQLTGGGLLQFEYRASASINTLTAGSGSFNDGSWHHMAVSYNGTDLDMYRDGVQVASFAASINLDTLLAPVYLASDTRNGIAPFGGQLDHLYIFDDSLSTSDIDELHRSFYPSYAPFGGECPQLIGAWDFEEGAGSTTADESGAGMTGTLVNTPTWTPGQFGSYGLDFSGSSLEHVDFGSTDFNLGSGFSIGFWLKSDGSDYLETILAKGSAGTAGHWQIYLNYGELFFRTDAPATISETSNYFFTDDLWHHVLINYNGGALMYYVDGTLVHAATQSFTIPALDASLTLGRRPDISSNEFNGSLDQLKIFNCALSDVQISRLLETGTIEALATQELQVFFLAKDPAGVSVGTQNSICVSGALFTDGRPANQGCDIDLANVTIINTGSITGRVFADVDGDGWQGSLGYEAGELGIPGVRVVIEGCTDFDAVGKVCNLATSLDTVYTDLNGDYNFPGLLAGVHYRVYPVTADLPDSSPTTTADPDDDPLRGSGDGGLCGGAGAACNDQWDNDGDWFEMLDDDWGGDDEEISAINFGYQIDGSVFGLVWNDINGDGIKDVLEPVMDGVMVALSNGAFAFTDANGIYTIQDIAPGSYTISVNEASLPWGGPWTETGESDGTINNSISQTMTSGLIAGSHDFGYQAIGTSELGDQLYYDWDGDGVQDSNEEGIINISVNLYRDVNENGLRDAFDIYLSSTVTDQDGFYIFSSLPEGYYLVGVDESDPDFPQATQTGDPNEMGTCTVCDGWGAEYLDGFWSYYDTDFGYKPLGTGSVGDLVWYDLDGNQLQTGSLEIGLPNISVTLKVDLNQDGIFEDIRTTSTDAQGNYYFSDLPDGGYEMIVDSTDADIPNDGLGTPYTLSTDGILSFTITNGEIDQINGTSCTVCNLNLDFGFTRLSAIGDMVYWDSNNNGTQDASEEGIPNVTVYLCDGTVNCTSGNAIATTLTSDGTDGNLPGSYLFTELPAGTYTVAVDPASAPLSSAVQTADPNSDGYSCDDPNIAILGYPNCDHQFSWTLSSSSQYVGADFGYLPLGVIGDYVWYDQNGDGLQDDGEQGFDNVEVYLCNSTPCNGANAIDTSTTDFDGGYIFDELSDGTYYINVNLGGAYTPTTGAESIGDFDAEVTMSGGVISAVDAGACTNCDLDVDFGFELVGPYSISGTVCLDDGSADGLCTGISGESAEEEVVLYLYDASNNLLATAETDVNGDYSFSNLAAGNYTVSLTRQFAPLSTADLTTTNADVPAGGTITESGSTVYQSLTLSASIVDADFAFLDNSDYDFGDLPSPYSTTTATNPLGAYHRQLVGLNLLLGSIVDSETEGIVSGDAYGDDGNNSDDEDGVDFGSYFGWSVGYTADGNGGSVDVTVTGTGYLVAWMDFNKDGDFGDADEMIINQAVTTGSNTYTFDIPFSTTFTGEFFSRFRIFENRPSFPPVSYLGLAEGGEVEDYLLSFQPLPAELLFFQAERQNRDVAVKWGLVDPDELPSYFEVERSLDGRHFQPIYQQDALQQDAYLEYNFLDQGIMETGLSTVFYRLKQVALDGIPSFSHIVEINLSDEPMVLLNLYPNPADTRLYAKYALRNVEADDLIIINSLGQTIWTKAVAIKEGTHTESIDVSQWPAGIYYLQLRHDAGKEVYKFVVR